MSSDIVEVAVRQTTEREAYDLTHPSPQTYVHVSRTIAVHRPSTSIPNNWGRTTATCFEEVINISVM